MNSFPATLQRIGNVVFITLFAGALAFPLFSSLSGLAPAPSLKENRLPAPFPEFKLKRSALAAFPARFEAYFNDHFAFRDLLVRWHNYVQVKGLGVSPRPEVLIGKKGWLYYHDGLLDHDGPIPPFTEEQLAQWVRTLEERQEWLAARGIRFLVVFPPDKHTIYPENLPGWVKRLGPSPRLDQLLAYARPHSDLTILDLREPLRQAKGRERLYYQTDTHWNGLGAFVGYQGVAESLARWFPQVRPLPRSAFLSVSSGTVSGDLGVMLGLPRFFREENFQLLPQVPRRAHHIDYGDGPYARLNQPEYQRPWITECDAPTLPSAVMLHDSFTDALKPYLSEHFRRIFYLLQDAFEPALLEREKPNVVIEEFVERRLIGGPPVNVLPVAGKLQEP